jgi:protein O-GlcNAc transferase
MKTPQRIALILPLVLVLIFAPIPVTGYAELSLAQSAAGAHDRSLHYEMAAQRLPWRPDLYEKAGLAALEVREYPRAIDLLQTAAQNSALTPNGRFEMGQAELLAGRPEQTIAEWTSLLADNRTRSAAALALSGLYHQQARFDAEEPLLRQWLVFEPANMDAQYRLGLLLFARASPDALPLLESVAAGGPDTLKTHVDGLRSTLKTALEQPDVSARLVICGRALASVGEWPLAQQSFLQAIQLDQGSGLAWAWLGEARQQTGEPGAGDAFGQALALLPASGEIHAMAGLYWQRRRDWQKALPEFEAAARLEPRNAIWQISLGDTHVHLGDLVKALADYQNAVDLSPRDPHTWLALSLFSVENNVDVETTGRDAALRAYALQPGNPQVLDTLARSLMATAQWDTAELFFKKAIAAAPNDPAPCFHLGLLYLQIDRPDLARKYLQSAHALDPSGPIGAQAANALARYLP